MHEDGQLAGERHTRLLAADPLRQPCALGLEGGRSGHPEQERASGYEAVVDAACAAWNALLAEPGRLRSLTNFPWLPTSVTTS